MSHLKLTEDDSRSKVRMWSSSFDDEKSSHMRVIRTHEFNYSLEIIVEDVACMPFVAQLLQGKTHYFTSTQSASCLYGPALAGWSALSQGTRLGADNAVERCRESGKILLQLDQSASHSCGLDSKYVKKRHCWRATLPGDGTSSRVKAGLDRLPPFALQAVHQSPEATLKEPWEQTACQFESMRVHGIRVPRAPLQADESEPTPEEMMGVLEWAGAVLAGSTVLLRGGGSRHQAVRPLSVPSASNGSVGVCRWTGMVSSAVIVNDVLPGLRELATKKGKWAMVIVRGFDDSLSTWSEREREAPGESNYAFFCHPGEEGKYWGYVMTNAYIPL